MLDDHGRRLVELEHDARGGVEIEQVRVRQLLALQDRRRAEPAGAGRDGRRYQAAADAGSRRIAGRGSSSSDSSMRSRKRRDSAAATAARTGRRRETIVASVARDRRVVRRRVRERLAHQLEAERQARPLVERSEQPRIVRRIDDDEHAAEVLGGRAHERRPADVDLLDERVERRRRDSRPP